MIPSSCKRGITAINEYKDSEIGRIWTSDRVAFQMPSGGPATGQSSPNCLE